MSKSQKCYCAFCKHERRFYDKKHITFVNVLLSLLASVLLMYTLWQQVDARVVIIFVTGICLAEIFVLFRWRLSLPCPHCGFDPVMYKRSPQQCAEKVKIVLDKKKDTAQFYLHAKNPFQNLKPVRKTVMYQAAPRDTHDLLGQAQGEVSLPKKESTRAIQG